jgi:NAD(P)-dependent dehydrogenase (short-subunit alcohol dehydrogenase family)
MDDIFSLAGKTILITGASSGIGKSMAIECSKRGAAVCIAGRNAERLQETLKLLTGTGHQIFQADLNNDDEMQSLAENLPALDGVVLNAGMVKTVPVRFIKRDDLDYMFNVNIQASIMLVQRLLKQKKVKDGGSICFVSSVATQKVTLGNAMYSATKGAVNSFTKALALEMAPKQIRVNAILPGFVETGILSDSAIGEDQLLKHKNNYPIGRFGKPEDIAYLSIYLLSDASQFMTGSLLTIDGGFSIK